MANLRLGDTVGASCERVAPLAVTLLQANGDGTNLRHASGAGDVAPGMLLLPSRSAAVEADFAAGNLTVCTDFGPFAGVGNLLRLALEKPATGGDIAGWSVAFVDPHGVPVPPGGSSVQGNWSVGYTSPPAGGTVVVSWGGAFPSNYSETLPGSTPGGTGDGNPGVPASVFASGSGTITVTASSDGSSVSVTFHP